MSKVDYSEEEYDEDFKIKRNEKRSSRRDLLKNAIEQSLEDNEDYSMDKFFWEE